MFNRTEVATLCEGHYWLP